MKTIIFVTHKPKKCGVYEFGKNVFTTISKSQVFKFIKAECDSISELQLAIKNNNPDAIIYNYHPSVMPWIVTKISKGIYKNNIANNKMIQIGIIHEVTQEIADNATGYSNKIILGTSKKKLNSLFDYYIAPDPTLLLKNPLVFKTGRLIPDYKNPFSLPTVTTIGSFGFGTPNKGFETLVSKVQQEFHEAIIRLNIPFADFGDSDGRRAKQIADNCRSLIKNQNIKLDISHEFLSDKQLLDFLAGNSLNAFMYEDKSGRGLSSSVDNALAVQRPMAVSESSMFRHVLKECSFVNVEKCSIKEILNCNIDCLDRLSKEWNDENLRWDYERILTSILIKSKEFSERKGLIKLLRSSWNNFFSLPDQSFTWLRNTHSASEDSLSSIDNFQYTPPHLKGDVFNRILDDTARKLYEPTIQLLYKLVPITMSKKIQRANVQQAFVFDTVFRFMNNYPNPKLLCIGSYEDTASMALQKAGYVIEEIDPMINYFLQDFFSKPSTNKNYYDIIFSTSVIEHDPDDKTFIECIEQLLAPGGVAILTCDYKDGWKMGEPKPEVDERFYTKYDLEERLPSYLKSSSIIGESRWDCPNPDFNYLGKYQYAFATFAFKKNK